MLSPLVTVRESSETTIAPEELEIANAYLATGSIVATADSLGISAETVSKTLDSRNCRAYVDNVYLDTGYRNRNKLGGLLDKLIDDKLTEMEDAEITTGADIVDLIKLAHSMRMDELKLQASLEKVNIHQRNINIQDNSLGGGNYGALLAQLMGTASE